MRQITITRVIHTRRVPVTITARPASPPKRRGPNPAMHAFFLKLGGVVAALLIIIPVFYYMATSG